MNILYAVLIAFSMYSRIPVPRIEWTGERMKYMLCAFPLVGAVIGAVMLLWQRFAQAAVGDGSLYTAGLVLIPILITGGIHMDGFLDTSDALSSHKPMEEKLEILKDSHTGAFAVLMCGCYFVLAFGVFGEVNARMIRTLAAGFVLSRALSGLSIVYLKKAKNSGLAYLFSDMAQKRVTGIFLSLAAAVCAAVMIAADMLLGTVCVCAAAFSFLVYRRIAYRQFGGITGDLAGFFLQVCELAMALAAVVAGRLTGVIG